MARERRRDDRKIESSFQIAAGLAVCTHRAFRVKVNRSFKSGTLSHWSPATMDSSPLRSSKLGRAVQLEVTVLTAAGFSLLRFHWYVFKSQPWMSGGCKATGLNGYKPFRVVYTRMSAWLKNCVCTRHYIADVYALFRMPLKLVGKGSCFRELWFINSSHFVTCSCAPEI